MFDFRCLIVPRFVYCTKDDFTEAGEPGPRFKSVWSSWPPTPSICPTRLPGYVKTRPL